MALQHPSGTREVKLIAIGNSRGIRLPKELLERYGWGDRLVLEELEEGIVLRGNETAHLSWEETYRAMAAESEDWSDLGAVLADGLD